jgi:hypothetical protein
LQTNPQETPSQVDAPLAGTGHGAQRVPQVAGLLSEAHAFPQAWYPPLQTNPHETPSQVDAPFWGTVQAVQRAPQVLTSAFE